MVARSRQLGGGVGSCSVGRDISTPSSLRAARQHETRRHEARQMQDDKMMHDGNAKTLETGKFHGKVHATSGRATVYQEADGKLVLRLTNFKTSNARMCT